MEFATLVLAHLVNCQTFTNHYLSNVENLDLVNKIQGDYDSDLSNENKVRLSSNVIPCYY